MGGFAGLLAASKGGKWGIRRRTETKRQGPVVAPTPSTVFLLFVTGCLLQYTAQADWRPAMGLAVGCLICAFFWEMWNFYSYPRWVYHVPLVGFLHVFEMPLLGYLGYIPFSRELFALYH